MAATSSARADARRAHLPWALLAGCVLLVAAGWPRGWALGPTCGFLRLTGYPCPFCGFTRAFLALGHGDPGGAWAVNPLGAVLYVLIALVFLWNAAGLLRGRPLPTGLWRTTRNRSRWLLAAGILLLALNWACRLWLGLR